MDNKDRVSINELNKSIDEYKSNMRKGIYYDSLKRITGEMVKKLKLRKEGIYPVKLYSQEQALSMALNFFKSLGVEEWYDSAKHIFLGQDENIGINIFDADDIEDLNEKDEYGLRKYSTGSEVEYDWIEEEGNILKHNKRANIKISLRSWFNNLPRSVLKDNLTLRDIYSIIHEISHTFDMGDSNRSNWERRLFVEITPFCFERMFGNYLTQNGIVSKEIIESIELERSLNSLRHARITYCVLNLIELKDKYGEISKENIDELLREKDIRDINFVRESFKDVILLEPDVEYHFTYAIAELTARQFIRMYKTDKKQALSNLHQYCENIRVGNTSDDTLRLIGCPVDDKEACKVIDEVVESREK